MAGYLVALDRETAAFYIRVAECAARPIEQVLSDALFKLAGELALEALAPPCAGPGRATQN